jgi:glycosyltransferase involved in cell wall biosynthesis
MKVSVLMSAKVYNETQYKWLYEAWSSIGMQTYKDFELVVIDDGGSMDISYFTSKRNRHPQGLAYALNLGLTYCTGDLIIRMDADDIAYPNLIEKQVEFFTQHPEAQICGIQLRAFHYQTGENCSLGGGFPTHHPLIITPEDAQILGRKGQFWFVNHPGIAFKKQTVIDIGGYQEGETPEGVKVREMEDMKLWLKMSRAGITFYNLPDVLMDYRYRPPINRRSPEYFAAHKNETDNFLSLP